MCLIKEANKEDLDSVIELLSLTIDNLNDNNLPIWNDEYPSHELIEEDIEKGRARVVLHKEEIIGYFVIEEQEEAFGEKVYPYDILAFSRFMVKPTFQGKGVGRQMISYLKEEAKRRDKEGLGILVHLINEPAIKFYRNNAFLLFDTRDFAYGRFHCFLYLFGSK